MITEADKKKQVEALKYIGFKIAELYDANIQIQIDVNNKMHQIKVKLSETI